VRRYCGDIVSLHKNQRWEVQGSESKSLAIFIFHPRQNNFSVKLTFLGVYLDPDSKVLHLMI